MPFQVGPLELIVVALIALVVLGPKRLPEAGRSIGRGIRELKGSLTSDSSPEALPEPAPIPTPSS